MSPSGDGNGGGDSRGCDDAKAGDGREPAAGLILYAPSPKLLVQHGYLVAKCPDLSDKDLRSSASISWQVTLGRQNLMHQCREIGNIGICNETKFCQMCPHAFATMVRWQTSNHRARWVIGILCCSTVLTGTKRIVGRCTAWQIASASNASLLSRLTQAFT
jgi:hypothetical protein